MTEAWKKRPELEEFVGWNERGPVRMGPHASHTWRYDPRRMLITFARYKHVAKLMAGKQHVLEAGCGDGFSIPLVLQTVPKVHGVDIFEPCITWAIEHAAYEGLACTFATADILAGPLPGDYDGVYSLDVIEHIEPHREVEFLRNIIAPLRRDGLCIVGTPNKHSEAHASIYSQRGHINLKTAETLRASLEPLFETVLIFSMNDEVLHTGFYPMAHYLFAVCAGKRS